MCFIYCHVFLLDDMLIKLWDWDKKWACSQVFEGHTHYVMMIVINPKDNNQFASASLDRTIKVSCHSDHLNFDMLLKFLYGLTYVVGVAIRFLPSQLHSGGT